MKFEHAAVAQEQNNRRLRAVKSVWKDSCKKFLKNRFYRSVTWHVCMCGWLFLMFFVVHRQAVKNNQELLLLSASGKTTTVTTATAGKPDLPEELKLHPTHLQRISPDPLPPLFRMQKQHYENEVIRSHLMHQRCSTLWVNDDSVISPAGLEFAEIGFGSLHQGSFHFFHFVEFMVVSFAELQRLNVTRISYISIPHMTEQEICGNGLNCHVSNMLWPGVKIYGNDTTFDEPEKRVESVLSISRHACADQQPLKRLWAQYIDTFPTESWETAVASQRRIGNPDKLHIGYIDRQQTRRRLPVGLHEWIMEFCQSQENVEFHHLQMEELIPREQVLEASQLDVLIGLHGNGLSHVLFMKPGSVVLELFWEFPYLFDYATASQMMHHDYLAIWNGALVDPDRVQNRDLSLLKELSSKRIYKWYQRESTDATIAARVRSTIEISKQFLSEEISQRMLQKSM